MSEEKRHHTLLQNTLAEQGLDIVRRFLLNIDRVKSFSQRVNAPLETYVALHFDTLRYVSPKALE